MSVRAVSLDETMAVGPEEHACGSCGARGLVAVQIGNDTSGLEVTIVLCDGCRDRLGGDLVALGPVFPTA